MMRGGNESAATATLAGGGEEQIASAATTPGDGAAPPEQTSRPRHDCGLVEQDAAAALPDRPTRATLPVAQEVTEPVAFATVDTEGDAPWWSRRHNIVKMTAMLSLVLGGIAAGVAVPLVRRANSPQRLTYAPSAAPSQNPSETPSLILSQSPSETMPSDMPTMLPSQSPSQSMVPSLVPTHVPSNLPTISAQPTLAGQWQLLAILNGMDAYDMAGSSVDLSADGTTVALGANQYFWTGEWQGPGYVQVYYKSQQQEGDDQEWTQMGQALVGITNVYSFDWFGHSVSLSANGRAVAVGGPIDDALGSRAGYVQVHRWMQEGSNWTQVGQDLVGKAAGDAFGVSVSLSANGTVVAIGAPLLDTKEDPPGYVQVYQQLSAHGEWNMMGKEIVGAANGDWFGHSVSLSADGITLAVGAPFHDGIHGSYSGCVRIYEWLEGAWQQLGQDINGEAANDRSGVSVSLSSFNGNTMIAIGAGRNDGNGNNSGHVRVYRFSGDEWVQVGQDLDGDAPYDNFGTEISLSATRVAIGAPQFEPNAGYIRVFQLLEEDRWRKIGSRIDGEAGGDGFGNSVALSEDGNSVAVGGPYNSGGGVYSGQVRVYEVEEE